MADGKPFSNNFTLGKSSQNLQIMDRKDLSDMNHEYDNQLYLFRSMCIL